jgi:hypothetical protein
VSVVREAPWIEGPGGRKGGKELKPFITMISTHMIAILENNSPLQQMANADPNKRQGFGNAWTSKHGLCYGLLMITELHSSHKHNFRCQVYHWFQLYSNGARMGQTQASLAECDLWIWLGILGGA